MMLRSILESTADDGKINSTIIFLDGRKHPFELALISSSYSSLDIILRRSLHKFRKFKNECKIFQLQSSPFTVGTASPAKSGGFAEKGVSSLQEDGSYPADADAVLARAAPPVPAVRQKVHFTRLPPKPS